jgi:hypothetical protein
MTAVGNRPEYGQNAMAIEFGKLLSPTPQSAKQLADLILGDATLTMSSSFLIVKEPMVKVFRNMDKIEAHLDHVAATNPDLATATRAEIMSRFSPAEQGELLRRQDGIMKMGPDNLGFNYAAPGKGMSQDAWIENAKATGHPDYARYVQLAGSEDVGAVKKAMDDVYTGRAVMPPGPETPGAPNPPGYGWSVASQTSQAVETANAFVVRPAAHFLSEAMDSNWLLKGSNFAGKALPVAGFGAQYMENRANKHSGFASTVGAGASTIGPALSGAAAGAGIGVFVDGVGAIPGAIVGAYVGIRHADEINQSGLTAAEFIENKISEIDVTKIEDSKGVAFGEVLNHWILPNKNWIDK